ncbi:DNA-directed RNA polymerase subunit B' [Candidatus Bilamarchaeum dharawalense]|uniref:DNA-directed RNA polymerase subunit beta n=1 Tax=Candidatus Bilamarchaeum dharawalense TaxID=2885759 RepID=A0A5E4LPT5_9ARCH|nr:DNA-directed RNA polymerase subunit B' [Candidatus Bilamarchaeum dharawalense]
MVKRRRRKAPDKTTIFLNGRIVGNHPDGKSLASRLRERRRTNELSNQVNIYYNQKLNELHILTDKGRVRRPYIVVENGKSRLTPEILVRIKNNELNWNHLVKMGIIEYLDAQEEENSFVAISESELTPDHTHLEVDPSNIFGVVAGVLPYPEHNSSPRITMACAMAKQSLGIYATNFGARYDTRAYIMYYPQQPLVQTSIYRSLNLKEKAAGQNCVVALTSYHGYNMADAIVVNRSSIDRGLHRVAMFKTYETEERMYPGGQKDKIELPTPEVVGYRGEESYRYLAEDGIVMPESEVNGKDVLVGKTSPPRFLEEISVFGAVEEKKRESSLSLKSGEKGKVDSVMITEGPSGNRLVKVRVRSVKVPEIGDKLASRHGQKGVIGLLVPQEDMPFTKNAVVPDLVVNPHAIPSRMTAGHLLETLGGKAGALGGMLMDGTAFAGSTEEQFQEILKQNGFQENGEEILYDGLTGKQIKAKIFIGNVYYQRLHHLVSNKMHVRSRGPVQLLTHQPTEGRAREGGLRFGEMERDCLIGYGASMLIRERLLEESDKTVQLVCTDCGSIATHDYARNRDICPICQGENVEPVEISYAFKLLLDEIKSLYIFPRIILKDKG